MKLSTLAVVIGLVTSPWVMSSAQAADRTALKQELEIMSSILNTALKQERGERDFFARGAQLSYTYLEGQGVVYRSQGMGGPLRQLMFHGTGSFAPVPPMPPMPELANLAPEVEVEVREAAAEGMAVAAEIVRDMKIEFGDDQVWVMRSEEAREQAEQMREKAWEVRDLAFEIRDAQRELRDLQYSLRNAPEAEQEELRAEISATEQRLAELETQRKAAQNALEVATAEQKQRVEKARAERQQQRQALLANFEQKIGEVFCKYGSTLRALPDNEHISVILEGFGGTDGDDKIYVFSKDDVVDCGENGNSSELIQQAVTYNF